MVRVEKSGMRWYKNDKGVLKPSVTEVVKGTSRAEPSLINWIKVNGVTSDTLVRELADYGTFLHIKFEELCACWLMNQKFNLDLKADLSDYIKTLSYIPGDWEEKLKKQLLGCALFLKEKKVKIIFTERMIEGELSAGTLDLYCELEFNSKMIKSIVDLKSGSNDYRSHAVQLAIYKRNMEWNKFKVSKVFNLHPSDWRTKPSYKLINQTGKVSDKEIDLRLNLFHELNTAPYQELEIGNEIDFENIDQSFNMVKI